MYLRYAKPYLPLAVPITAICWSLVFTQGPAAITAVLFFKVATLLLGLFVLRKRHRFDIFFYQNVGYGERRLLSFTAGVDMLVWLIGLTLVVLIYF